MKFIDSSVKTNWKFLAIAVVFTLIAVGAILLLRGLSPVLIAPTPPVVQQTSPLATSVESPEEDEQRKVVEYLQQNITMLVKAKPVLGASKFFVYDKVEFYEGNKFIVPFEDGHIGGYVLGKYSIENGEIQITYFDETLRQETLDELKRRYGFVGIDTSGWQTYRNEEFGFELQHPSQGVGIKVITGEPFLEAYLKEFDKSRTAEHPEFDPIVILDKQVAQVGPYEAVQYETAQYAVPSVSIETYFQIDNGAIIRIASGKIDQSSITEEMRHLHSQILSTFRLVE